jgi:hypothetical protein
MDSDCIPALRALEGRHVCLALQGGGRIDDCQLVSVDRDGIKTIWIFVNGVDAFIPHADILDFWETATAA